MMLRAGMLGLSIMLVLAVVGCSRDETTVVLLFDVDYDRAVELELLQEGDTVSEAELDELVQFLAQRLQALEGPEAGLVRRNAQHQIEVVLQGPLEQRERVTQAMQSYVTLEVHRLANDQEDAAYCQLAGAAAAAGESDVYEGDVLVAEWLPVAAAANGRPTELGAVYGTQLADLTYGSHEAWPHVLSIVEPDVALRVTGARVASAAASTDEAGFPCVRIQLDNDGTRNFSDLIGAHLPKPNGHHSCLAFIMNGEVQSAPAVTAPVTDGRFLLVGEFTEAKVQELVAGLSGGGELSYPLKLVHTGEAEPETNE